MTDQERNAAIGAMAVALSEAKRTRAALIGEARGIGKTLNQVASQIDGAIMQSPLYADRGETPPAKESDPVSVPEYASFDFLVERMKSIRKISGEIRQLRRTLRDAGMDVE
jgi:hypothetical protein